jgi:hypothetical protein
MEQRFQAKLNKSNEGKLTLITMTGSRPKAWALCERYMSRQTYSGLVRWIIVDDGEVAQPITFAKEGWTLEVVRPEPFWQPGQNTQTRNVLAGLEKTTLSDRIVFIEDDDWYSENWLSVVDQQLKRGDLVGEQCAIYYNIKYKQYHEFTNRTLEGLCSTALKGKAF